MLLVYVRRHKLEVPIMPWRISMYRWCRRNNLLVAPWFKKLWVIVLLKSPWLLRLIKSCILCYYVLSSLWLRQQNSKSNRGYVPFRPFSTHYINILHFNCHRLQHSWSAEANDAQPEFTDAFKIDTAHWMCHLMWWSRSLTSRLAKELHRCLSEMHSSTSKTNVSSLTQAAFNSWAWHYRL